MPHEHPTRGSGTETEMQDSITPAAYVVHRDFDPKAGNPDGLDFVLTPAERDRAKLATLELERKRREANARDTAQSVADALVREWLA